MRDGEIRNNTAKHGGGVYVYADGGGTFIKSGGSIIAAADDVTKPVKQGKVAYVNSAPAKLRNSAAGPNVDMDSRMSGSAGGWE
jgi:hypothetical protein